MALFGGKRDISLFRKINREFMRNIVSQQCVLYKYKLEQNETNIYGENPNNKFYTEPTILFALISRKDQSHPTDEMGVDFNSDVSFRFLRDDLVEANLFIEVGDIVFYNGGYYEIDNIVMNQLFMGKDPDYPNDPNPLNPGLENFGNNLSVICNAHYVPSDKVNIEKSRLWPRKEIPSLRNRGILVIV